MHREQLRAKTKRMVAKNGRSTLVTDSLAQQQRMLMKMLKGKKIQAQ